MTDTAARPAGTRVTPGPALRVMTTPIDVWPSKRYHGKPGYSARHFADLAGGQDDPLRVAERLQAQAISDQVSEEARLREREGEPLEAILEWQMQTASDRRRAAWEDLCGSWDELLAVLELYQFRPGIKRFLREAKAAAKRSRFSLSPEDTHLFDTRRIR